MGFEWATNIFNFGQKAKFFTKSFSLQILFQAIFKHLNSGNTLVMSTKELSSIWLP